MADKRAEVQVGTPAWTPAMVLDGAPLPADALIRDFQRRAGYVADAVEQALLLPSDTVDLKTMRKHEVCLTLKRDLDLVSPLTTFPFPFIIAIISFIFVL